MRIGVDATALYGRFGGVEYALWNLLEALRECEDLGLIPRSQWKLWMPRDGPLQQARRLFPANWRFEALGFDGRHKLRRIAWQQTILPAAARRARLDVLHCPTYVCPLKPNVPVVLTIYDFIALSQPRFATRLNRVHYGLLLPLCARRAARVLIPSQTVERDLNRFAPGARGVLVPLGVGEAFGRQPSRQQLEAARLKWGLPARFVLFVGNPEPKKNVRAIVEAMRLWPRELGDVPLIVTGGARAWKSFEAAALQAREGADGTEGASAQVRSLGYVERDELALLYRLCAAFAFPSLAEGFGLPVLEALASGARVVASQRVPIAGLQNVARLVDPLDIQALSQALAQAVSEVTSPAQAQKQQEWASNFSWRRAALSTFAAYQEAAGRAD